MHVDARQKMLRMVSLLPILSGLCLLLASGATGAEPCGAQAHLDEPAAAEGRRHGTLQCPGYAEERSCCNDYPVQKVQANLQAILNHEREHIALFGPALQQVEATALGAAGSAEHCGSIYESMLQPRLSMVRELSGAALAAMESVEHLVVSGLCAYCLPEEEEASFRISQEDGPAVRRLSSFYLTVQDAQQAIWDADVEHLALKGGEGCVPAYLEELASGAPLSGSGARAAEGKGAEGADADADAGRRLAFVGGVEALSRLRQWPLARRGLSTAFRAEAADHFDEDFVEAMQRMAASVVGPIARLVHQAMMLALAFAGKLERVSSKAAPDAGEASIPELEPTSSLSALAAHAAEDASDASGASHRFGMIVLISNQTSSEDIQGLLERLRGPRTLFFEDVCGDALEALGYGCHNGGEQQRRCLAPGHAALIDGSAAVAEAPAAARPLVAWRRHASTRSVVHSAWSIASSYWGEDSAVWLADLRPEGACPGVPLLADVVSTGVPGAKIELVRRPAEMLGLPRRAQAPRRPDDDGEGAAQDRADLAQGTPFDRPLAARLAEYADFHRRGLAALAKDPEADVPVLIWSCQPYQQCGGHGDRFNGIVTAFLLAVLTRRVFLLDSESPLPLQMFLAPRLIDWRVRGGLPAMALLRHHTYHDKRRQFEADLGRLAEYPERILVLNLNYRMLRILFEAPALRPEAVSLGLLTRAPPFLAAEVFDMLFTPARALRREVGLFRQALGGLPDGRFIAIHFRTGDISWDPARHSTSDFSVFLRCAQKAETELGLPPETPWLLATDSASVVEASAALPEVQSGKLRVPGNTGRIHIDRSGMNEVLDGAMANYAEWLLFGRAAAVVLSRSFFGETAAEVGRVRFAYFAPGGGCVRTDLSSS